MKLDTDARVRAAVEALISECGGDGVAYLAAADACLAVGVSLQFWWGGSDLVFEKVAEFTAVLERERLREGGN